MSKTGKSKSYQWFPAMAKTKPKGAGRYLPTGNHSGCGTVHIPECRCMLWQALWGTGIYTAPSSYRTQGLPKGSDALRLSRHEMRGLWVHHRLDGLFGEQPHHRPLLRVRYHETTAVLLDIWPLSPSTEQRWVEDYHGRLSTAALWVGRCRRTLYRTGSARIRFTA